VRGRGQRITRPPAEQRRMIAASSTEGSTAERKLVYLGLRDSSLRTICQSFWQSNRGCWSQPRQLGQPFR
jgi:hypothetical protein